MATGRHVGRLGLALVLLSVAGCSLRYLKATAAGALDCDPSKLTLREQGLGQVVDGCGRTAYCFRARGPSHNEWVCQTGGEIAGLSAAVDDRPACNAACLRAYRVCVEGPGGDGAEERFTCRDDADVCLGGCDARFPVLPPPAL